MARIPMGNFGQGATTAPLSRVRLPGGDDPVARAVGDLAQTGMAVAADMQRQEAEARQQRDAMARVEAHNASAEYELRVGAAQDQFAEDLKTGRVDWRNAATDWGERLAEIEAPTAPPDADEVLDAQFQGALSQTKTRAGLKVDGLVRGVRQAHFENQAAEAFNKNIQVAAMPGGSTEAAIRRNQELLPLLREAGFDEAKAADMVRKADQAIYVNEVNGRIGVASGNVEALQGVLADLTDEKGRYVPAITNPDTRLDLANAVRVKIDQAQTSQRVAVDKRESAAEKTVEAVWKQAQSGVPPTPEMITGWKTTVAGTSQEGALTDAMKTVADVQLMLRAPELEQDAYTQDLRRKLAAGGTPEDLSRIENITKTIEESQKLRREAPLSWLEGVTGVPTPPIDFGAMLATRDASALADMIDSRASSIRTLQKAYGANVRENLLLPGEAKMLASVIDQLPHTQLLNDFALLRDGVGSTEAFTAMMKQIAPDAPMKAYAGEISVRPHGRKPASLLLRGNALLDTKEGAPKFPMPATSKFEQFFADTVGSAYRERPEDFQRDLQAFRAVYAGALAQDGKSDAGQEFDEKLAQSSLAATLGGPPVDYNGKTVIAPWGVPADQFTDKAEALVDHALKAAGLEDKGGITLVNTSRPGVYYLAVGRIPVMDPTRKTSTGQPGTVFIDFNAPTPATQPKPLPETGATSSILGGGALR